jgi:hypothetical protein
MGFRKNKTKPTALVVFVTVFAILCTCGCIDNQVNSNADNYATGSLQYGIAYHGAAGDQEAISSKIDCAAEGISTINVHIYGKDSTLLISGGAWNCNDGHGTVSAVPAGNNRSVVVIGKDTEDNAIFRGENPSVNVVAGQTNDAGTIDCYAFVPDPNFPDDGALAEANAFSFSWSAVVGASQYVIKVSENSDSTLPPLIDEVISATAYRPSSLSMGRIYYWQVFARDSHGNESMGSNIRSVKLLGVLPIVPILSSILKNSSEAN